MEQVTTYIDAITKKDEQKALSAAKKLIEGADVKGFNELAEKMQYLFDFIRNNVNKRLLASITGENHQNIKQFMVKYSAELEDFIVQTLVKYANEDLSDELLELLESGTNDQKTYCAKYFSIINDPVALEALQKESFSDFEPLAANCAQALKAMEDTASYEKALKLLNTEDEFDKIKAARFLIAYGDDKAVEPLLNTVSASSMPENIAGMVLFLCDANELVQKYEKGLALNCILATINGLGEILPLFYALNFNLYGALETIINQEQNGKTAITILKAKQKFELLCENDEYTFDETKDVKQELKSISELLNSQPDSFYDSLKNLVAQELTPESKMVISAIELIKELTLTQHSNEIKSLLNTQNEILIAESVSALKALDRLNEIDKNEVLSKFNNQNLKAIVENLFI